MIELKFLSDGVASAGLLWLRVFARVIPFVKGVRNASLKRFITLSHYIKAAVCLILAISLRFVKTVITKLQAVILRK